MSKLKEIVIRYNDTLVDKVIPGQEHTLIMEMNGFNELNDGKEVTKKPNGNKVTFLVSSNHVGITQELANMVSALAEQMINNKEG